MVAQIKRTDLANLFRRLEGLANELTNLVTHSALVKGNTPLVGHDHHADTILQVAPRF